MLLHTVGRGVARIFQRGGHRGQISHQIIIRGSPTIYGLYRWFSSSISRLSHGMKALINQRQEPLTKMLYKKTNFKKVGFSTMAFTAKILSWRFHHLNIVGCLLKGRPPGGDHRHPRTPLATPLVGYSAGPNSLKSNA